MIGKFDGCNSSVKICLFLLEPKAKIDMNVLDFDTCTGKVSWMCHIDHLVLQ